MRELERYGLLMDYLRRFLTDASDATVEAVYALATYAVARRAVDPAWETRDGRKMALAMMDSKHLYNAVRMLRRQFDTERQPRAARRRIQRQLEWLEEEATWRELDTEHENLAFEADNEAWRKAKTSAWHDAYPGEAT